MNVTAPESSIERQLRLQPRPGMGRGPQLFLLDAAMLGLATLLTAVGTGAISVPRPSAVWLAVLPVITLVILWARGTYERRIQNRLLDEQRVVLGASAVAAMTVISLRAVLTDDPHLAAQTIAEWLCCLLALSVGRGVWLLAQKRGWARGQGLRPTLIVGAGRVGHLVAGRLLDHPEGGLKPIGFLDKQPLRGAVERSTDLPVLGASWDLDAVVAEHGIENVIVTFSTAPHDVLLRIVHHCEERGLTVSLVPRLFEKMTERLVVEHLGGLPVVTVNHPDPKGWQFAIKHTMDRLAAAAALLVTGPILAGAVVAVRTTMGAPILYRQRRVGRDGRVFEMLKLRSMRPPTNEPAANGEGTGADGDDEDRLTGVGTFLRRTSIDELPQLLNVLRGEMSIVGPRPERPELAQVFEADIHRYAERHRVKSGITGWAQVHGIGRGSDRFSRSALGDRVEWDNYYIENWSLWLDIKILLMTLVAVLRFRQP